MAEWVKRARLALAANTPAIIWGPPGVGKTDILQSVSADLFPGKPFHTLIISTMDPSEIHGMPVLSKSGKVSRAVWDFVERFAEAGGGTLFLDELSTATPAAQGAALRIPLARVIGDTPLPPEVRVIAAANPVECSAGGFDLSAPMANRFAHINVGSYATAAQCAALSRELVPAWIDWAIGSFAGTESSRRAAALVTGYVAAKSDALFDFPAEETARAGAWASPRSWAALVRALAAAIEYGDLSAGLDMAGGYIGQGQGTAFRTYAKNADLPNPRDLLSGARVYTFDRSRADLARAVLTGVAVESINAKVAKPIEREDFVDKAWQIIVAACDAGLAEATPDAAKALAVWRVKGSGSPLAKRAAETTAYQRLDKVISRAKKAAGLI